MTQRTQEVRTYRENDALPAVRKTITQEKIARYAEASGDHNPLHLDPAFAATTQFGGTIAHGMLVLASISEMMTAAFGKAWLTGGRLKVRFRGAARPGDTVIASGRVIRHDRGNTLCEVVCRNQEDVVLISGEAEVAIR